MVKNNKKRWEEIADILRNRIISGTLRPGEEFPTNLELMKEFNVHTVTIQTAVSALIREGLVMSTGTKLPRKVRPLPHRSVRLGGFLTEHGEKGRQEVLNLCVYKTIDGLPESVIDNLELPILFYHTRQWRDGILVAVSKSFIPYRPPLKKLKQLLKDPSVDLYKALDDLGQKPFSCEESLIAAIPTIEEAEELMLPGYSGMPIVRLIRKVFDCDGNLLEFCLLTDRADCYEFVYQFQLNDC